MAEATILLVDDEPLVLRAMARTLGTGYRLLQATDGAGGLEWLGKEEVAVILADQRMPGLSGDAFLKRARSLQPEAVRILITGYADIQAVVRAVNDGGIYFYVEKPWEPEELRLLVANAVEHYRLQRENRRLMEQLKQANQNLAEENRRLQHSLAAQVQFDHIVGESPAMQAVFQLVKKVIPTDVTVLIQGETGTGKELIARAIHFHGLRKDRPFLVQNCGALPDTLLESELFGHEKGAFTGAERKKKGLFEAAQGGTVFLDEISDTSPSFQQRLLRVLQEGEIRPLGATRSLPVDVRIIAASNRDLQEAVRTGAFREDLYYRLHVVPIQLPPLRDRREDIPLLARHFLRLYSTRLGKGHLRLSQAAIQALGEYPFPGNVRELENMIQRAAVLAEPNSTLTPAQFPGLIPEAAAAPSPPRVTDLRQATAALERRLIEAALQSCRGNVTRAARQLGLSRLGLYKKLERLQIQVEKYKHS